MFNTVIGIVLCCLCFSVQAALSPAAMNSRDLDVMVKFIAEQPRVANGLEYIDFKKLSITFDSGCIAQFRKVETSFFNDLMPGPQPGIEFTKSTCELTDK